MAKCRIDIEMPQDARARALPGRVFINGAEIPNVSNLEVHYRAGDARRVVIELIPTDFVEIPLP